MSRPTRWWLAGIASVSVLTMSLAAQERPGVPARPPAAPSIDPEGGEILEFLPDVARRMTIPVAIAGRGPFNFVVDTGSERTVISRELARDLALDAGRVATVHSMTEVSQIATVIVPGLTIGQRTIGDVHAPALAERTIGAAGMLGVDSLQRQNVVFDFERQIMTITPSRRNAERWPAGAIVVTGRSRFGRLMLIDAAVDGTRVYVIVDTGSEVTVANEALRRRLESRGRFRRIRPIHLMSVTGGTFTADYAVIERIRIGGIDIEDLPIAFYDAHPFRQLDLLDRPALLLGMDALRLFERVSVDFGNRTVRVLFPAQSNRDRGIRMASDSAPDGSQASVRTQ